MITLKSEQELSYLGAAGRIVADVLAELREVIITNPGITTQELDRLAESLIVRQGAKPAFKGYRGFPCSLCTSVNEQVVHGIPGDYKLQLGDIISLDLGVKLNGYYGDAAITVAVGKISGEVNKLLEVTEDALYKGIRQAKVGNKLSDISYTIQSHVEKKGFSVVRALVGHGIGRHLHEEPPIPNFGKPHQGPKLKRGMTLAIEPMVNMGSFEVRTTKDDWTVVTKDGKPSAHFEHTIAIRRNKPEILTLTKGKR
ncbi:type I methionyl aminopeptidase [Candidatus Aerophobetes bacterium]|uniref:Methionine aminopeptidase n=1 Tax=Aerophobetes bacterium TaxID=2030807 RepID=A0A523UMJ5_UNCAE|nr:MAG: type I methionyl aminopeptidase [Candidatus Aerophobetes bacterium]